MPKNASILVRSSQNILLRRLSDADQALLEPDMEVIPTPCGATVLHADRPLDAVYFPDSVLVTLEQPVDETRSVEIGVVGREGMLGWAALLGASDSSHTAVVRMRGGTLLRIGVAPLRAACRQSPSLWAALLQFVNAITVQMARSIASHLHHSLDQRVARWLLMRHDRVGGDVLLIHHDEIAESLRVRRASITDRLHILEGHRLIRCTRGHIVIRDRPALDAFAGDAYGFAEAHYRALIAPFGKSPAPAPVSLVPRMLALA